MQKAAMQLSIHAILQHDSMTGEEADVDSHTRYQNEAIRLFQKKADEAGIPNHVKLHSIIKREKINSAHLDANDVLKYEHCIATKCICGKTLVSPISRHVSQAYSDYRYHQATQQHTRCVLAIWTIRSEISHKKAVGRCSVHPHLNRYP